MSLFNKFSIGYRTDQQQDKTNDFNNNYSTNETNLRINEKSESVTKQALHQEIVKSLIEFGFSIDQIMLAFKTYKFKTIDDAIYILMKDNETGKYNHRFFHSKTNFSKNNSKFNSKLNSKNNSNITIDKNYQNRNIYQESHQNINIQDIYSNKIGK